MDEKLAWVRGVPGTDILLHGYHFNRYGDPMSDRAKRMRDRVAESILEHFNKVAVGASTVSVGHRWWFDSIAKLYKVEKV